MRGQNIYQEECHEIDSAAYKEDFFTTVFVLESGNENAHWGLSDEEAHGYKAYLEMRGIKKIERVDQIW